MPPILSLSLEETALDSLQRAELFLDESETDGMAFKWFIIAIHHTLYCSMLIAIMGSAQENIWKGEPKDLKRTNTGDVDMFADENALITFLVAYNRIKNDAYMRSHIHSKSFKPESRHDEAMEFLNNDLRNQMIHYKPMAWGGSANFIAECLPAVEVLEFLIFESGNVHLFQNREITKKLINNVKNKLRYYSKTTT